MEGFRFMKLVLHTSHIKGGVLESHVRSLWSMYCTGFVEAERSEYGTFSATHSARTLLVLLYRGFRLRHM